MGDDIRWYTVLKDGVQGIIRSMTAIALHDGCRDIKRSCRSNVGKDGERRKDGDLPV